MLRDCYKLFLLGLYVGYTTNNVVVRWLIQLICENTLYF